MKNGMYGEMPKLQIGRFSICLMSDKKDETKIWIDDNEEDAGSFPIGLLESHLEEFYNKYF